jgi:NADH:ubiquinone oxidoreductase subunit 3 (subunit A)
MTSLLLFLYFVPILVLILLGFQGLLAVNKPDREKLSAFECGITPHGEASSPFSISFYLVAILFLVFDLEILFLYPLVTSIPYITLFGYWVAFTFLALIAVGFVFELALGVITTHSRFSYTDSSYSHTLPPANYVTKKP